MYSFNKYVASTSWVPGPVLGPGGSAGSKVSQGASPGGRSVNSINKECPVLETAIDVWGENR